ncbi:MAG: D-glycerate dehydrogenase [Reyranella sp.]|uniref:NAD(P)-dependent oxidoreductase n=1 Tax=Reyranella sp. TaxID=1929291 RepID=UPI001ACC69AA|nr:NAD(P)-dependent oxidoreductase [Reyranella sp.]MBN9088687.1 D-glycerate dehydrogenase [Reyranella sp.]
MFDVAYEDGQLPPDEAVALVMKHQADAIFFTSTFRFDARFIEALPDSVKVAASASSFLDHADVAAARARGLVLTYAPDIATGCVADLAFGLVIGAARGFGRIGRAFAHRCRGFGLRVVYHDRRRAADQIEHGAVFYPDLEEMLPLCDFVSLHTPLKVSTRHILDRETLALLPRGAIVVNGARGGLIDEAALIDLLESGHLGGAGLDVFEQEPTFNPRLAGLDNVFLTPHITVRRARRGWRWAMRAWRTSTRFSTGGRRCARRARASTISTCAGACRRRRGYQCSRLRPIAMETAAWLGSTTGRPTWRCRRSR